MTPPSLEVAREILANAAAKARAAGDSVNEVAASAIDVVLAALDRSATSVLMDWRSPDPLPGESAEQWQARIGSPRQAPGETDERFRYRALRWRQATAEPAPGAARVLCGMPVDGRSCFLRYGHDGGHAPERTEYAGSSDGGVSLAKEGPIGERDDVRSTHEPECAVRIPGGECSCPVGWCTRDPQE